MNSRDNKKFPVKKGCSMRVTSLGVVFLLAVHCIVLPGAYSLTVEEQAGRRQVQPRTSNEEFSRRVPERRDRRQQHQSKDPRLACLMSLIIPGGGHIYLRRDLKGVGFCLLAGAAYGASGYYLYQAFRGGYEGTEKKSKMVIAGLFFVVAAIVHVVGVVEAYNDAIEINERDFYYGRNFSRNPYLADFEVE